MQACQYENDTESGHMIPSATLHAVIGMGGQTIHNVSLEELLLLSPKDWQEPPPSWSMVRSTDWGYTSIEVLNANSLHFQFIRNVDGEVFDDFYITNWGLQG